MALSASTGFRLYGGIDVANQVLIKIRIGNSQTLTHGELVRVNTSGFVVTCATGESPAGGLVGFVDANGVPPHTAFWINNAGITISNDDTIVTSSTNTTRTDNFIYAQIQYDPAGTALWYNDADADLAATNLFQFYDVASGNQVTEATRSDANGQVQLVSLDPDNDANLSKGLFRINESQFNAGLDTATAKNAA